MKTSGFIEDALVGFKLKKPKHNYNYDKYNKFIENVDEIEKKLDSFLSKSKQQFKLQNGKEGELENIFTNESVNILLAKTPPGEMEQHSHEQDEWIGVIEGEITVIFSDGKRKKIKQHQAIHIEARKPHRVRYETESIQWVVLMPSFKGFDK